MAHKSSIKQYHIAYGIRDYSYETQKAYLSPAREPQLNVKQQQCKSK